MRRVALSVTAVTVVGSAARKRDGSEDDAAFSMSDVGDQNRPATIAPTKANTTYVTTMLSRSAGLMERLQFSHLSRT